MNQQTNNSDLMVSGPALPDTPLDTLPDKAPEKKKKKKLGAGGKILIVLGCILLAVILAVGAFGYCLLKDTMPQPSEGYKEMDLSAFVVDAAKGLLADNTITLESQHLDYILATVKENLNSSDAPYVVNDLFMVISDGKATLYGRADVDILGMTITVPAQVDVAVSFADNKVILDIQKVTCGVVSAPDAIVSYVLDMVSGSLPENFTVENGSICYDVSTLGEMIDQELANQISASTDGWLAELLVSATQELVDVELTDAYIDGDKLIIEGSVLNLFG